MIHNRCTLYSLNAAAGVFNLNFCLMVFLFNCFFYLPAYVEDNKLKDNKLENALSYKEIKQKNIVFKKRKKK